MIYYCTLLRLPLTYGAGVVPFVCCVCFVLLASTIGTHSFQVIDALHQSDTGTLHHIRKVRTSCDAIATYEVYPTGASELLREISKDYCT